MPQLSIKRINVNEWLEAPTETAKIQQVCIVENGMGSGKAAIWITIRDLYGKEYTVLQSAEIMKSLGSVITGTEQYWKENPTGELS